MKNKTENTITKNKHLKTLDNLIYFLIIAWILTSLILIDRILELTFIARDFGLVYPLLAFNIVLIAALIGYYVSPSYKKVQIKFKEPQPETFKVNLSLQNTFLAFGKIQLKINQDEYDPNREYYLLNENDKLIDTLIIEKGRKSGTLQFKIKKTKTETYHIRSIKNEELKEETKIEIETKIEDKNKLI